MNSSDILISNISKMAILAFGEIARINGVKTNAIDFGKASDALKSVMKSAVNDGSMIAEWNEIASANISHEWQEMALKAQAWGYAQEAWREYTS